MIYLAVVIVLIVLIIANVVLGFYNWLYPPCESSTEYFVKAKAISNDKIKALTSVQAYKAREGAKDKKAADKIDNIALNLLDENKSHVSKKAEEMLSAMFPTSSQTQSTSNDGVEIIQGKTFKFNKRMEGVKATPFTLQVKKDKPGTQFMMERDGYE